MTPNIFGKPPCACIFGRKKRKSQVEVTLPAPGSPLPANPLASIPAQLQTKAKGRARRDRPPQAKKKNGPEYRWPNEPSAPYAPPCEPATEPSDRDIPTVSTEEELGGLASSLQTPSVLYCVPPAPPCSRHAFSRPPGQKKKRKSQVEVTLRHAACPRPRPRDESAVLHIPPPAHPPPPPWHSTQGQLLREGGDNLLLFSGIRSKSPAPGSPLPANPLAGVPAQLQTRLDSPLPPAPEDALSPRTGAQLSPRTRAHAGPKAASRPTTVDAVRLSPDDLLFHPFPEAPDLPELPLQAHAAPPVPRRGIPLRSVSVNPRSGFGLQGTAAVRTSSEQPRAQTAWDERPPALPELRRDGALPFHMARLLDARPLAEADPVQLLDVPSDGVLRPASAFDVETEGNWASPRPDFAHASPQGPGPVRSPPAELLRCTSVMEERP